MSDDKNEVPAVVGGKKPTAQAVVDQINAEVNKAKLGEMKNKAKALLQEIAKADELAAAKRQALADLVEEHGDLFSDPSLNV